MRRKLIKQGIDGLTMYLPKKWADRHGLKAGDEVEIGEDEAKIIVVPPQVKKIEKKIELKVEKGRRTKLVSVLVNSYRTGFDKIILDYDGSHDDIRKIVSDLFIGFEVFQAGERLYSIESVAEPDFEDFEKIVQKILFILLDMLSNLESDKIELQASQVQKYDNLLKRMLSRNMLSVSASFSFWHFLSNLVQISRQCQHLSRSRKRKFTKMEGELAAGALEMMKLLQKAYLKSDLDVLFKIHDMEEDFVHGKGKAMLEKGDALNVYYLVNILRFIYMSASPLAALIESQSQHT